MVRTRSNLWWAWGSMVWVLTGCGGDVREQAADGDASPTPEVSIIEAEATDASGGSGSADWAPPPVAASLIPLDSPSMFAEGDRSDLTLSSTGNVALVVADYLSLFSDSSAVPRADVGLLGLAGGARWLTLGVDGRPHPILSGRVRFQRLRNLLLDLIVQSHAPVAAEARVRLDLSVADLDGEVSLHELADHWETLAQTWGGAFPEAFSPTMRALRNRPEGPVAAGAANDGVRALAAEAIMYANVIERMRVLRVFSRSSTLNDDPAFVSALSEAQQRIKKRRSLTVVATTELLRVAPPAGSVLSQIRLPVVPERAVAELFPGLADSLHSKVGFDRRAEVGSITTSRHVQDVDGILVLYATLESALFPDLSPEVGCEATDRDVPVAVELRRYLALRYAEIAGDLLRGAPSLVLEAWDEHAAGLTDTVVDEARLNAQSLASRLDFEIAACDRQRADALRLDTRVPESKRPAAGSATGR